jgi:hypothetical protein
VRSRGAAGASDEFIELYNPTASDVSLDTNWKIEGRAFDGSSYSIRWKGAAGRTIPANGHFLITGTSYTQMPVGDDTLSTGITDAASLRLVHVSTTVDAVCYSFSPSTLSALQGATFTCEGTPVSNLPHNDKTTGNGDVSIERAPGGTKGNCTDTDDNSADFVSQSPATPENSAGQ